MNTKPSKGIKARVRSIMELSAPKIREVKSGQIIEPAASINRRLAIPEQRRASGG